MFFTHYTHFIYISKTKKTVVSGNKLATPIFAGKIKEKKTRI